MKHTEHQDDVYFVVAPEKTEEVLNSITVIWEEECGLQINQSKTKIWAEDANLKNNLPEGLSTIWSPTMNILGNRTQIALREGGAALNLGNHTDDDLPRVVRTSLVCKRKSKTNREWNWAYQWGIDYGNTLRWQQSSI